MKTAEEILESHLLSMLSRAKKSYVTIDEMNEMKQVPEWEACINAIEQAQKEAYNQALEDVAKSIKLKLYSLSPYDDTDTSDGYDLKGSYITPLYTGGFNGFINGKIVIDKDSIYKLKK